MRVAAATLLLITGSGALADDKPLEEIVFTDEKLRIAMPFSIRDQNPLLAGFGLPSAMPSRIHWGLSGGVDLSWGSTALMQSSGNEDLLVDAETRETRVTLQGPFEFKGKSFAWQLQLPYRYTGGGSLDGFIDSWHDTFGLPDGARSGLPQDRIGIRYTRAGSRELDIDSSASGLGDIQAALGYELPTSDYSLLMAWLTVKLPTGDADELTGSGGTDVSLLLSGEHVLGKGWDVFGQAAVTYLGDGDLLPDQQRSVVWSGMLGVNFETWRGLSLKAQIDAHTAAYDSNLDFFSDAVVLTVGGDYYFEGGLRLELGVSEDIAVEHSPDVVFVLGVKQSW